MILLSGMPLSAQAVYSLLVVDWDASSTITKVVEHGLLNRTKILFVSVSFTYAKTAMPAGCESSYAA